MNGSRPPLTIVVFGSSGNLAATRLLPAIETEMKTRHIRVVGVDREPPGRREAKRIAFVRGDLTRQETYSRLKAALAGTRGHALFYLATGPRLFPEIVRRLKIAGDLRRNDRIAVEKPFGVDLRSARLLEGRLRSAFAPKRIFRVDHFLFKDGAVGLERFRFADGRLEGVWNRRFVDSVQIMADEDTGAEERGEFYDSVGVVRDMVQNHLLQLFCLVAMDRPRPGCPPSRRRAELLRSVAPVSPEDVVWGQYRGYERTPGVRKGSRTPTFVALKLLVRNPRWDGVPFYVRSGKSLARDATEVVVAFKGGVEAKPAGPPLPRVVRFGIDPEARTELTWGRSELVWRGRGKAAVEGEHRRAIRGVMRGDLRRFVDSGFNELSWRLFDPVIEGVGAVERYEPSGRGPASSDLLLAKDGRRWLDGRGREAD